MARRATQVSSRDQNPAGRGGLAPPDGVPETIGGQPDEGMSDHELLAWVDQCRRESADALADRLKRNKRNRDANLGRQDWSHKMKGQSREFLPKVHMAAEQFAAFVQRALTQFGRYYQVDMRQDMPGPLREEKVAEFMDHLQSNIYIGAGRYTTLATLFHDGVKLALFESMIILKVHGEFCAKTRLYVEPAQEPAAGGEDVYAPDEPLPEQPQDQLKSRTLWPWKCRIDLIRPDNYFPDPSGRGLYEIHEVERDLYEVVDMAEQGIYDQAVVAQIHEDFLDEEEASKERSAKGQQWSSPAAGRKRVRLREYWGTILNNDGLVEHRNCVMTIANEKYVIRKPEPNPFWHGESPFIALPLIRVPLSVSHVALYDDAVSLNLLMNEMFSLMVDGGIESVWGVRQVRVDELENPEDISNGITPGMTLAVKGTLPHNAKVVERLTDGKSPQEAMAVFEMLQREFNQSALTNDIKLGSLPNRPVTATEVNDATNSQSTTLDAIASDIETEGLTKALKKMFLVTMQHLEWMDAHEVVSAVGPAAAFALGRMSTAQRYAAFSYSYSFRVFGLSAVMTRARDFQRLAALMQMIMSNPILLQEFMKTASPRKLLVQAMKMLNINPDSIQITPEEQAALPQTMQGVMQLSQITNPRAGGGRADGAGGEGTSNTSAEINQMENPISGMGGGT